MKTLKNGRQFKRNIILKIEKILEKDKVYKKKNRTRYNKRTAERYKVDLHFNLRSRLKNRVNHIVRYGVKNLNLRWNCLEQTT